MIDAESDRFVRLFCPDLRFRRGKVVPQVHLAGKDSERVMAERNQKHFYTFIENGQAARNLSQPVST